MLTAMGLGICLIWPMLAVAGTRIRGDELPPASSHYLKSITHVEIIGHLKKHYFPKVDGKSQPWHYEISLGDKNYILELRSRFHYRLAVQLEGKTVRVKGQLDEKFVCPLCLTNKNNPGLTGWICTIQVENLEEYRPESVRRIDQVVVCGKLEKVEMVRCDGKISQFFSIRVNDQSYQLNFGDGLPLSISRMVGLEVVIQGQWNTPKGNVIRVENIHLAG
jgi:hypothetical protein